MDTIIAGRDEGLRSYLVSIYNWMILGLLISGAASYLSISSGLVDTLKGGGILMWVVMLAPFALIFLMGAGASGAMNFSTMLVGYLAFTGLLGLSLSVTLIHYTGQSILTSFLATAVAFGSLSLYGYTTRRNLNGIGSFLIMALFGLIAAMVINIFVHSSTMNLIISIAGVLIFAGLTAYDTQKMKGDYIAGASDSNSRMALWNAVNLYLDFLNLFLFILRLTGNSSSKD